jgi:hypothetical protein
MKTKNKKVETETTSDFESLSFEGQGKLQFPSWRSVLNNLVSEMIETNENPCQGLEEKCSYLFGIIESRRNELIREPLLNIADIAREVIISSSGIYLEALKIEELRESLDNSEFGSNEFYSVFDALKYNHTIVDDRIRNVLGIHPDDFSVRALFGADPLNPLYHPHDYLHLIRCSAVGYMVLGLPGFVWKSHKDFYRTRFRVGTVASSIEAIKDLRYVTMEMRAYMGHDRYKTNNLIPSLHLNRWTVFLESEFDGIRPYFSSDPYQTTFMNAIWYVLNAAMLDIPTKFACILEERRHVDRNKAVANRMNEKVIRHSEVKFEFDERQIADCFSKTIRQKIAASINEWEKREKEVHIISDQEAVYFAQQLSLVPMPQKVNDIIYRGLADV